MPTYNNPINFGSGFKIGQGVPIDDRYVFDDIAAADAFIVSDAFFLYEGLWVYLIDPGDYFLYQRTDPSIPWDGITNPYIWKQYSALIGGLPTLGLPNQQLVINNAGTVAQYEYFNQRGLHRFIGASSINPSITEGMFVRHVTGSTFEDVHTPANYPINAVSKLPTYFVFKIDGNDFIVGKSGVYNIPSHQLTQRVPLYLQTSYTTGSPTYFTDTLTPTPSAIDGELNLIVGNAIDSNTIFIDLTRNWDAVSSSSGGTGNATIQRELIQRAGAGGAFPEDPDGFFTVPHGFGNQRGQVEVVALGVTPPAYPGGSGNEKVTVDTIAFESNAVRLKLDYGVIDPNLTFEVILIF